MDYAIATDKLTKTYGNKDAVKEVSIKIREGQIYGLIGRNGAGKTTLMKMLTGLARPSDGNFSIFGKTGAERQQEMKKVGALIEAPGIYPHMSAYDNVKLKCLGLGVDRPGYVEDLLKQVRLEDTGKLKAGKFSLGMVQRLGIALALVGEPKMLILDEPINGLDPQGIVEMRITLARLRDEKNITIMISSHILEELGKLADSYGILHEGKLMEEFTRDELQKRSGRYTLFMTDDNAKACDVIRKMGIEKMILTDDGKIRIDEPLSREKNVVKMLVENDIFVKEVACQSFSLEDYYLSITGGEDHG